MVLSPASTGSASATGGSPGTAGGGGKSGAGAGGATGSAGMLSLRPLSDRDLKAAARLAKRPAAVAFREAGRSGKVALVSR